MGSACRRKVLCTAHGFKAAAAQHSWGQGCNSRSLKILGTSDGSMPGFLAAVGSVRLQACRHGRDCKGLRGGGLERDIAMWSEASLERLLVDA